MAHTEGFEFDNIDDFKSTCETVLSELEAISKVSSLSVGQRTAPLQLSPKAQRKGIKSQVDSLVDRRIKAPRKEYSAFVDTSRSLPFNKSKRGIENRYINKNMNESTWKAWLVVVVFTIIGVIGFLRWEEFSYFINTYNNPVKLELTPYQDHPMKHQRRHQ